MNRFLKYCIIFVLLFIMTILFYKFCFNFNSNVYIAEDMITKLVNNSFTDSEQKLEGIVRFNEIVKNQSQDKIFLRNCNIYKIKEYSKFIDVYNIQESEDGADFSVLYFEKAKVNVVDTFIKKGIATDIEYEVINNDIAINLSDFEFYYDYFEIEIDDVIFRINIDEVNITFNTFINNILKNNNTFKLVNITEEIGNTIFEYKDVITGYTAKIKYIKNIFGYPKDIQIEISSVLYN